MIVGGAVIAIGSRLTWARLIIKGSDVSVPGLPRVALADTRITLDAAAVGSGWIFGIGLLIALVPLAWLVLGWRGRLAFGLIAFAAAALVFYQAAANRSDVIARARRDAQVLTGDLRIETGPGIPVTAAGGAVAAIAAMWGATVGKNVPRLRLPERPPGDPQGNGHR